MSNKRIQKKRAKAELQRDKSKVITNLVVLMEPGLTRAEYLRIAKPLWKLDMNALFELSERVIDFALFYRSPMVRIKPYGRSAVDRLNSRLTLTLPDIRDVKTYTVYGIAPGPIKVER